jgi:hypothetical protein
MTHFSLRKEESDKSVTIYSTPYYYMENKKYFSPGSQKVLCDRGAREYEIFQCVDGKLDGTYQRYMRNKNKEMSLYKELSFANGVLDGGFIVYDIDKNCPRIKGNYNQGEFDGDYYRYSACEIEKNYYFQQGHPIFPEHEDILSRVK